MQTIIVRLDGDKYLACDANSGWTATCFGQDAQMFEHLSDAVRTVCRDATEACKDCHVEYLRMSSTTVDAEEVKRTFITQQYNELVISKGLTVKDIELITKYMEG